MWRKSAQGNLIECVHPVDTAVNVDLWPQQSVSMNLTGRKVCTAFSLVLQQRFAENRRRQLLYRCTLYIDGCYSGHSQQLSCLPASPVLHACSTTTAAGRCILNVAQTFIANNTSQSYREAVVAYIIT